MPPAAGAILGAVASSVGAAIIGAELLTPPVIGAATFDLAELRERLADHDDR